MEYQITEASPRRVSYAAKSDYKQQVATTIQTPTHTVGKGCSVIVPKRTITARGVTKIGDTNCAPEVPRVVRLQISAPAGADISEELNACLASLGLSLRSEGVINTPFVSSNNTLTV